jgi:hypothetical protein
VLAIGEPGRLVLVLGADSPIGPCSDQEERAHVVDHGIVKGSAEGSDVAQIVLRTVKDGTKSYQVKCRHAVDRSWQAVTFADDANAKAFKGP